MFLEEEDVELLRECDPARREENYEVVFEESRTQKPSPKQEIIPAETHLVQNEAIKEMVRLYEDAKQIIVKKDEVIQDLSYRLGKSETELKNSISLIEYKKATFMLESAKTRGESDTALYSERLTHLEHEVSKKNYMIITLAILLVLVLCSSALFVLLTYFA